MSGSFIESGRRQGKGATVPCDEGKHEFFCQRATDWGQEMLRHSGFLQRHPCGCEPNAHYGPSCGNGGLQSPLDERP